METDITETRSLARARNGEADHLNAIRRVAEGAWRQRRLIVLPILLLTPMLIAGVSLLPQSFTARTLLMLQETAPVRPLSQVMPGTDASRDKQPAAEALLKSDRLLGRAVGRIYQIDERMPKLASAKAVEDLRRNLSVRLIGQEFVELRLQGSAAAGLGKKLRIITAMFLDELMSQTTEATGAKLVLDAYREAVSDAEKQLQAATLALETGQRNPSALSRRPSLAADAFASEPTDMPPSNSTGAASTKLNKYLQDLMRARDAADRHLDAARQQLTDATARLAAVQPANPVAMLQSPERIIVVDPASDPLFAKHSRATLALAGFGAIVLLSLLLATLAEMTDQRVRTYREFEDIAGAPVVATLNHLGPVTSSSPDGRAKHAIIAIWLLVLGGVAIAMASRNGMISLEASVAPHNLRLPR